MEALQIVERYLDAWNETDPASRDAAVAAVYADDARYVDPLADVAGPRAISELIGAVQQQVPGHYFRLVDDEVDAHHNVMRFRGSSCRRAAASRSRSGSTSPRYATTGGSRA